LNVNVGENARLYQRTLGYWSLAAFSGPAKHFDVQPNFFHRTTCSL